MTQPEPIPTPEEMRTVFRAMQLRMRNYALHQFDQIDLRTVTALQALGLTDNLTDEAPQDVDASVDLAVLLDVQHPKRIGLPPGPLVLYLTEDAPPKRMIVEVPVLLYSSDANVRSTAYDCLDRMVSGGMLQVTPKTRKLMEEARTPIKSNRSEDWRWAAIALSDAFCDDVLVALQGVRQCLESEPVIQDSLNTYVPRIIYPKVAALDSIVLEVSKPEAEHAKLIEIVGSVSRDANSLSDACARYYARLGFLPLAPMYAMGEVVARWVANHQHVDVWSDVWAWARGESGPLPRYHACAVFVQHPEYVPEGKLPELWQEILGVVHEGGRKGVDSVEHEPWALRRDLAKHFLHHLEAHLPEHDGANIACFAWWLSAQVASLFPVEADSAQFYRKNWVEPALSRSLHIWLAASPSIGVSPLRYVTTVPAAPWAVSLLAMMGASLDRLLPQEQDQGTQALFAVALVSCLIDAIPFGVDTPPDPSYALECALGETAQKWAAHQVEEEKQALAQLVNTSRTLRTVEGLCEGLRGLDKRALADQVALALAFKARAYLDATVAEGVWGVLSDAEWRMRVLGTVEERVLGLLLETFIFLQAPNGGKWFSLFPLFVAELCEKADSDERRRQLFLYLVYASLASDTVSAIRRLLRGPDRARYTEMASQYRESAEGMWDQYPPWVQGKLRALLASLRPA